jgi:3-oxoacyl-[acyl-carrier protein] reductase
VTESVPDFAKAAARLAFADISVGDEFAVTRTFTAEDVRRYAELSGDFSPLHVSPEYAAGTEFGGNVVHGLLVASLFSQLVGMRIPGERALYMGQDMAFRKPVMVGETVTARAKVSGLSPATSTIELATEIRNADGVVVTSGTARVKVRGTSTGTAPAPAARTTSDAATGAPVALVTGGSRGIGAAIARVLAAKGFSVGVNYVANVDAANAVCHAIADAGGKAYPVQGDVTDARDSARMVAGVAEVFGGLSLVVNGATGPIAHTPAVELEWARFQAHLDTQLRGAWQVCKAAHPHLKASGRGAVVNILSSVVDGTPPAGMADYTAAKYALFGLSKTLAAEWAADGIRVNMVSPGMVQTDLTGHYKSVAFRMEAGRTPLKRLAQPDDIANAVAYLAGNEASFLTGMNVFVTGGQVMP